MAVAQSTQAHTRSHLSPTAVSQEQDRLAGREKFGGPTMELKLRTPQNFVLVFQPPPTGKIEKSLHPLHKKRERRRDRANPALVRNNPAEKMKLPLLVAVTLSGGRCPSDAFVPKAGVGALTSRSRVEPWAAARSAQPGGVSMKSQATSVKVEVSLGLKLCPLDRASVACKLKSLLTPAFFVFLAERVLRPRERHAGRSR